LSEEGLLLPATGTPDLGASEGVGVMPIGEASLVEELRLVQLDLKWRLAQRNAAINASALAEARLQSECGEAALRLAQAQRLLAEERKKLESAQRNNSNKSR
jgi:hypothetical protein